MIITVSRQFGSGGRELGKKLADELKLAYYDKELVNEIAKRTELDKNYVNYVLENGGLQNHSFSFTKSIPVLSSTPSAVTDVLVTQQSVIEAIADRGDCVIVGRCADVILHGRKAVNIFVYADEKTKLARCRVRENTEKMSDKQLIKLCRQIDRGRADLHDMLSSTVWGDKQTYDLLINTLGKQIEKLISPLAALIKQIYESKY